MFDLIKESQIWLLDVTVKEENRKNRIKELLKMSEYVPSILVETRKEALEEGMEKERNNIIISLLKEINDIDFILKITPYSLSEIKKAAQTASINIKI